MAERTRSDSPTKTCTRNDCDRPLRARGLCSAHYKHLRRDETGRSHHVYVERTCATCGKTWQTPRPDARFCTATCKGVHLAELNRRKSLLPDDHPVILLIKEAQAVERERREAKRREAQGSRYEWRIARECPGCGCWFTPLWTPTAVCCSNRCAKRMSRRRRRAREHNTLNDWRWSDFMQIARKFGYCCAYCGERDGQLEPDHVIPLSRGGADTVSNLLPACHLCNADKNARTLIEWAAWRAERGKPPRVTTWQVGDMRYVHLTDAALISPAA